MHTFDDLLDKGYDIVTNKKEERDVYKEQEEALHAEINNAEHEIGPLINHLFNTKNAVAHQQELKAKYQSEIAQMQNEIQQLKRQTEDKVAEIKNDHEQYTNQIKTMELSNNDIRSQMHINRAVHRQEKNEIEKVVKQKQGDHQKLVEKLSLLKKTYEEKKMSQAERLRKMENKSKMYMGILKH